MKTKLFQKLIKVLNKFKSKQTKLVLNGKTLNLADNMAIKSNNFNVDSQGNMSCNNAQITGGKINVGADEGDIRIRVYNNKCVNENTSIYPGTIQIHSDNETDYMIDMGIAEGEEKFGSMRLVNSSISSETKIDAYKVVSPIISQISLEKYKKNFEKLQDNALETIKNIDIYKYNLKSEKDTDKKHIGFVIGDNYNYSKEVTSIDNQGVDNYSFTSLCCKAIQELSQQVEELKKQLKEGR